SFSASTKASPTAIIEMPRIMLLQILAACPAPASPQCTTLPDIGCSAGSASANASAEPPAMKVSVPATAPAVPPDTGASTDNSPLAAALACAARAASTSTVEQPMNTVLLAACGAISS